MDMILCLFCFSSNKGFDKIFLSASAAIVEGSIAIHVPQIKIDFFSESSHESFFPSVNGSKV